MQTQSTPRSVSTRRQQGQGARGVALALFLLAGLGVVPDAWAQTTGTFDWLRQFGAAGNDFTWAVHTDGDGNVYVAGGASGALPGQVFAGGTLDGFLRKYDPEGNELWTRQFGTTGTDQAFAIFVVDWNVYVGGQTNGVFPGQAGMGGFDAYLRKYDVWGNEHWTRQFGTPAFDELIGIFGDATSIYVSGGVTGALPGQLQAGGVDAFVRRYDADGYELWTRQFGTAGPDVALRIGGDATGVYVVGRVLGALPGQRHAGGAGPDAFIRKYDVDGSEQWTRQFGTQEFDIAIGVAADDAGVYIVGRTDGPLPGQIHTGGADAFVRCYDPNGNELWTRQFGTPSFDVARGVSVRGPVVYVSGVVGATGPAFPGTASAVGDVLVRALTGKGTELWTEVFGAELNDDNWGIAASISGLYVIGSTVGALQGLESQGGSDAFAGRLVPEIIVGIDIRPGGDPNVIRIGPGIVPVAILSSSTFDAATVDPSTVALEGAGVKQSGRGIPMASLEDVNGDNLADLVLHFETAAFGPTSGAGTAELTGRTFSGRVIFGLDSFRIVR